MSKVRLCEREQREIPNDFIENILYFSIIDFFCKCIATFYCVFLFVFLISLPINKYILFKYQSLKSPANPYKYQSTPCVIEMRNSLVYTEFGPKQ